MREIQNRRKYFDVIKEIAIILVVVGHATNDLFHCYAYTYHLALFFFISGVLYNEKKYGNNPALNIGNKIKNNWGKYLLYSSIIGILHFTGELLGISNILGGKWNFAQYRNYFLNNILMNNTEAVCGAMWFVAPLIIASGILGLIVYWGNKVEKCLHCNIAKHITIILLAIACLLLGNERMVLKFQLQFRLDVALFVTPLLVIGYYIGTYLENFYEYLKWYVMVPFLIFSLFFSLIGYQNSIVSQDVTFGGYYFLAIIGIYQSLYFAKLICSYTKNISAFLSFIGKYTFEIMCFHFLVFKIIDFICYAIKGDSDVSILSTFPHTYNLGYVYVVFGCLIPAVVKFSVERIQIIIKKVISKSLFRE